MTLTRKLIPTVTITMTSLAPLFFALMLTGCNFQALQGEAPQITLEIPKGYAPAQEIKQKTWEEVAAGAQRMALNGPDNVETPAIAVPAPEAKPTAPIVKMPPKVLAKAKKKSKHYVMASKRRHGKRLVTASPRKLWKPVQLVAR